jgi:hypothetical protein
MKANGADTGKEGSVTEVDFKAEMASLKVLGREAPALDFEFALTRAQKRFGIPKTKLRAWAEEGEGEPLDADALVLSLESAQALIDGLKPELLIDLGNLPATAYAIRDAFKDAGNIYERGVPVVLVPGTGDGHAADSADERREHHPRGA